MNSIRKNNRIKLIELLNPFWSSAIIFLFGIVMYGQETGTLPLTTKLTINDFAAPRVWWSSEQHSSFEIGYKISPSLFFEWRGNYDSYRLADVFKTPLLAKFYITNRFYMFSGIELEMERDKMQIDLPPPQLKYKNGFGYDVQRNFMLQFEHDLHFNKSIIGAYGTPSLFSLSGKYKF
jgi:hypothetical protein